MIEPQSRSKRWHAGAALLLVCITLAVYGPACSHAFTWWDDPQTIHHNPRLNPPSGESIRQAWVKPIEGLYAPITYSYWGALAFAAEMKEADEYGIHLNAAVFHAASLLLHMFSALMVFAILKRLIDKLWPALAGALLFALHPVQVETVAWASGAKDLLAGLLSLCAIHQYLAFAQCDDVKRREKWTAYTLGAVLLLLAMLSKPSAMVTPAIVAVIDRIILGRSWRQVLPAAAVWMLLVLPLAIVARVVQTSDLVPHVAIWQRFLVAADALVFYLWKLIWPVNMAPDYGRRPEVILSIAGGVWAWIALAMIAGVAIFLYRSRASRPWILALAGVFVLALLPVLGFTPFMFQFMSTVADHYLYLAMLAPAALLAWLLVQHSGRRWTIATALVLAALALRSRDQLTVWSDDRALWTHNTRVCPDSFASPANLAANFGREGAVLKSAGEIDRSRHCFERAVELLDQSIAKRPDYITARHNAFINNLRLGRYEQAAVHAEAMLAANEALPASARQNFNTYHDAAGQMWMKAGRYELAAKQFELLLQKVPEHLTARQSLEDAKAKIAEARIE